MPRSQGSTVPRVVVDLDEVGEGGPITVRSFDSRSRRLQTETQSQFLSQTQFPNCTPDPHVGAARWGVDVTRGHQLPCSDGGRGPSGAGAQGRASKSPGTTRQERSDWMPNGGVGWTAMVLQADEQMLDGGGGDKHPNKSHWSSMEHREYD
jgi:hypothetical protein